MFDHFFFSSTVLLSSLDPGRRDPLSILVQPPDCPDQTLQTSSEVIVDQLEVEPVAVEELNAVAGLDHLSELVICKGPGVAFIKCRSCIGLMSGFLQNFKRGWFNVDYIWLQL